MYEHNLRPEEKQHGAWVNRITVQLLAACREWNALLKTRPTTYAPDRVAVTSTVIGTFIESMSPVSAALPGKPAAKSGNQSPLLPAPSPGV
ncbi:hypothetical protein M2429_002246 [Enterobacter sp. A4]